MPFLICHENGSTEFTEEEEQSGFLQIGSGTIPKLLPSHARGTGGLYCAGIRDVAVSFVDRYRCYLTSVAQFPFLDKELQKGLPVATELCSAETGF